MEQANCTGINAVSPFHSLVGGTDADVILKQEVRSLILHAAILVNYVHKVIIIIIMSFLFFLHHTYVYTQKSASVPLSLKLVMN